MINKLYVNNRILKTCTFLRKLPSFRDYLHHSLSDLMNPKIYTRTYICDDTFKKALRHIRFERNTNILRARILGNCIEYNPKWMDSLSDEDMKFAIAHECLHYALSHLSRQGTRQSKPWFISCDYEINHMLIKIGFNIPTWVLANSNFYDLSAEEIYERELVKPTMTDNNLCNLS